MTIGRRVAVAVADQTNATYSYFGANGAREQPLQPLPLPVRHSHSHPQPHQSARRGRHRRRRSSVVTRESRVETLISNFDFRTRISRYS